VALLTEYAFDERRLEKLAATVYEHNPASMRVLEKAGWHEEAVLEREAFVGGESGRPPPVRGPRRRLDANERPGPCRTTGLTVRPAQPPKSRRRCEPDERDRRLRRGARRGTAEGRGRRGTDPEYGPGPRRRRPRRPRAGDRHARFSRAGAPLRGGSSPRSARERRPVRCARDGVRGGRRTPRRAAASARGCRWARSSPHLAVSPPELSRGRLAGTEEVRRAHRGEQQAEQPEEQRRPVEAGTELEREERVGDRARGPVVPGNERVAYSPSSRPRTRCCISLVPSPISMSFASR